MSSPIAQKSSVTPSRSQKNIWIQRCAQRPSGQFLHFAFYIIATSTPLQKNRTSTHPSVFEDVCGQGAAMHGCARVLSSDRMAGWIHWVCSGPLKRSISRCYRASAPTHCASGAISSLSGCSRSVPRKTKTPVPLPLGCSSVAVKAFLPLSPRVAPPNWASQGLIGRRGGWQPFRKTRRRSSISQPELIRKRMSASAICATRAEPLWAIYIMLRRA